LIAKPSRSFDVGRGDNNNRVVNEKENNAATPERIIGDKNGNGTPHR